MLNIINTYSSSFKYDLQQSFNFNDINITNYISNSLYDIIAKNEDIKVKINDYKELKTFLGKKRKNKIDEKEFINNIKHFKGSASLDIIKKLSIYSMMDGNLVINDLNNNKALYIFIKSQLF